MPIRRITIHVCVLGVMLSGSTLTRANTASWDGSYVAQGQCFCAGTQGRKIDSQFVPTPIGGQTVAQVCERIGTGPKLQNINGKFNFTVYPDAQCGNGPFPDTAVVDDPQCLGHLGVSGEDCSAQGPKWDLDTAYATDREPEYGIAQTPVVIGGSRYITPPVSPTSTAQALDRSSVQTDGAVFEQNPVQTSDLQEPQIQESLIDQNLVQENTFEESVTEENVTEENAVQENVIVELDQAPAKSAPLTTTTRQAGLEEAPLTQAQIRERQVDQLAAARERESLRQAEVEAQRAADANRQLSAQREADAKRLAAARLEASAKRQAEIDRIAKANQQAQARQLAEAQRQAAAESVAQASATAESTADASAPLSALKLPAGISNPGSRAFDYVEGAPVYYDYGGAGMSVAASKSSHNRVQYLFNAAAAESYQEARIGLGLFLTPAGADRLTVMLNAGVEYGNFEFRRDDLEARLSDTGAFLGIASRLIVTQQFELQAGAGYSSFFEGDAVGYAAAFFHMTPQLDFTARAEAGDNDMFGFGIRYHY